MTQRNYNETLRAVFLAAIMVTSVFAGTLALSGSAAAVNGGPGADEVTYDDTLVFQGQNVDAGVDGIGSEETAELRAVEGFDTGTPDPITSTTFVEEITASDTTDTDGDYPVTVDTDDLESGYYIVVDQGGSTELNRDNTFEVTEQDLSAEFDSAEALPETFSDSTVTLDVSSGRSDFNMNVSADGELEDSELFNVLVAGQLDGAGVEDQDVGGTGQIATTGDDYSGAGPDDFFWSVTDDGDVDLLVDAPGDDVTFAEFNGNVDDSNIDATIEDGDEIAGFSSPYAVFQTAALDVHDIAPFDDGISGSADGIDKFGHNGDVVTTSGGEDTATVGGIEVGFYAEDLDSDTADYDEKVFIGSGGLDADVSFVNIDEGDYSFDFSAADTEAATSADVAVREIDADADFEEGTSTTGAGDIAEFNFTLSDTDETYVQIGSESAGFVDVLYLAADDADEPMNVQINTRLLGTNGANTDIEDVYNVENVDTIQSELHTEDGISNFIRGTPLYEDDGNVFTGGDDTDFETYLDSLGLIDSGEDKFAQLIRPLQATEYEVAAAGAAGEDVVFDADPGGEANNQLGSKVITLSQPEIGDITIHTAPEDDADGTTEVSELVSEATQRSEVAVNDRLIVQVEATGIYGAMVAGPDGTNPASYDVDWDRLEDGASTEILHQIEENTEEQISFGVSGGAGTGNQAALEAAMNNDRGGDTYLVLDEENGQFFLVVDTSSDSAFANGDAPSEAQTFTASLAYDGDNADNQFELENADSDNGVGDAFTPRNPGSSPYANYPYLPQGETLSSSTEFDLAPRSIEFDNLNEDDQVQVQATEEAEISGTTNVAPGSSAEIRLSSTDASSTFRQGKDINITEDGSVSSTFALSDQEPGDQFTADFRVSGSSADSADGIVVEAIGGSDEEQTNETDTDDGAADDGSADDGAADDGSADDGSADDGSADDGGDDGSTDDGTPGFGAVVALVALVGAALLAVRRQN